jgi:hypothetical protein
MKIICIMFLLQLKNYQPTKDCGTYLDHLQKKQWNFQVTHYKTYIGLLLNLTIILLNVLQQKQNM